MSMTESEFQDELQRLIKEGAKTRNPILLKIEDFIKERYLKFKKIEGAMESNTLDVAAACTAMDVYIKIMLLTANEKLEEAADESVCFFKNDLISFSVHQIGRSIVVRSRRHTVNYFDGFIEFSMQELGEPEPA